MSYKAQLPSTWVGTEEHVRKVTQSVNILNDAFSVNGEFILNGGVQVVENVKIGEDAIALLQPMDGGAADVNWYADVQNGTVVFFFVSGIGGKFRYKILL